MGTGRVYFDVASNRYLVDLTIRAIYDTAGDDETLWEASFRQASIYLFDATYGQMQLGSIGFLNNTNVATKLDDAILNTETGNSGTFNPINLRTTDSRHLHGQMRLTSIAMHQPLETTHEIGHCVAGLADEYVSPQNPVRNCTGDATSGACIMEFAKGYGIILEIDDGQAVPELNLPLTPVTQFCFPDSHGGDSSHLSGVGGGTNYQELIHCQSCWETLEKHFSSISIANHGDPIPHEHSPIQWNVRSPFKKYALAIYGSPTLVADGEFDQIRESAIAWSNFIAGSDDEFALVADTTPNGFVREFAPITAGNLADLIHAINQIELGNGGEVPPIPGIELFDELVAGSYQFLILVVPGDASLGTEDQWRQVAIETEQNNVHLVAVTLGTGTLATLIADIEIFSPRFKHVNVLPAPANVFPDFVLLSILTETYFLESPGLGEVAYKFGILPAPAIGQPHEIDAVPNDDGGLHLHPQTDQFDFPVYVETGAVSAFFLLSLAIENQSEFTLIQPGGQALDSNSRTIVKKKLTGRVQFFQVKGDSISGRWILRIRRLNPPNQQKQSLPFHLFVASENPLICLSTDVVTKNGIVRFSCTATHQEVLDYIDAKVDLFRLNQYGSAGNPFLSIVLQRETKPHGDKHLGVHLETEVSTGVYRGSTELDAGDYVAIFRVSSFGNSVYANNPAGSFAGNTLETELTSITTFTRINRHHFSVG